KSVGCLVLDIDHFKRINDVHGHLAGDQVLKTIADVIRAELRSYDLACRYGGEEFAILLLDADLLAATAVAERIRREVQSMNRDGVEVTVSIGVADSRTSCTLDSLFDTTDTALYRAKSDGRNQVTQAVPPHV